MTPRGPSQSSAKSAVEKTDPSHAPDPEAVEDEVAEALSPWIQGEYPEGARPPADRMPLLDFPFIYHGGSWFKGPYEIVGDQWVRRKIRPNEGRGRVPGIDVVTHVESEDEAC